MASNYSRIVLLLNRNSRAGLFWWHHDVIKELLVLKNVLVYLLHFVTSPVSSAHLQGGAKQLAAVHFFTTAPSSEQKASGCPRLKLSTL